MPDPIDPPPPPEPYDCKVITFEHPSVVVTGEEFSTTVVLQNTGSFKWCDSVESGGPFELRPSQPWNDTTWISGGAGRKLTGVINPGDNVTVISYCKAPQVNGDVPIAYEMWRPSDYWFGEVAESVINVCSD